MIPDYNDVPPIRDVVRFFQNLVAQLVALTQVEYLFEALDNHFVSLRSPCKLYLNLDSVS